MGPWPRKQKSIFFNKVYEIIHLIIAAIAYFNIIHTNIDSNILDLLNNTLPCQIFLTNVFEVIATYCCLAGLLTDRGKLFTFVAGSHHHLSLPFFIIIILSFSFIIIIAIAITTRRCVCAWRSDHPDGAGCLHFYFQSIRPFQYKSLNVSL